MTEHTKTGRNLLGKLAELERLWHKGQVNQADFCLALQFCENGTRAFEFTNSKRQTEIKQMLGVV